MKFALEDGDKSSTAFSILTKVKQFKGKIEYSILSNRKDRQRRKMIKCRIPIRNKISHLMRMYMLLRISRRGKTTEGRHPRIMKREKKMQKEEQNWTRLENGNVILAVFASNTRWDSVITS